MKTLLLHGFTGRADSWHPVAAGSAQTVAIDLPGHGAPVDVSAGFAGGVAFVAAAIRDLGAPVHLVGYSLGGRLALGVCVVHPELVERATLIGAGVGIDNDERETRRAFDAKVLHMLRVDGLETFLRWWSTLPLFATQAGLPIDVIAAQDAIRRSHDPAQLADAFEAFALSRMPDYRPHLRKLAMPVRYIAGALDTKYCAIAEAFENVVIVENAGHNVLLERPDAIAQAISVSSD